jgi:hypothetical protein
MIARIRNTRHYTYRYTVFVKSMIENVYLYLQDSRHQRECASLWEIKTKLKISRQIISQIIVIYIYIGKVRA